MMGAALAAQADVIFSENFGNPTDHPWRTYSGYPNPPFVYTTDQGRTVAASSNPSQMIIAYPSDGFGPLNVANGELKIQQTLRFNSAATSGAMAEIYVGRTTGQPIVAGELAFVEVLPFLGPWATQMMVARYTNSSGNYEYTVNAMTPYTQYLGTSYQTLTINRSSEGVWTVGSDVAGALLTATESTVATGSHWNYIELRNQNEYGAVSIYRDNVSISLINFVPNVLPPNLAPGVQRVGDCWYLVDDEMVSAVNALNGTVTGIFTRQGTCITQSSYDLYNLETAATKTQTDERQDTVQSTQQDARGVTLTCTNPNIANVTLTKRYFMTPVQGVGRSLGKEVTVVGTAAQKTLLSLVSRTCFDGVFRNHASYTRVKPTGTSGNFNTVPATSVFGPMPLYYSFNVGAAANLCAANPVLQRGLGQYFFKVNSNWVVPGGYGEDYGHGNGGNVSYFTDTGWDMAWFATFISSTPQSGEMRYHLFQGDRTTFHQEYRDLPERLAVVNAAAVSPLAAQYTYTFLTLGPGMHDIRNPATVPAQQLPFYYPRLRSDEFGGNSSAVYRDVWYGDYPSGDNALLHYDYPPTSPTYPAYDVRDAIVAGTAIYPRILTGWYETPQNICYHSGLAGQHPEFMLKAKDGTNVPSGWSQYEGVTTFAPEFISLIVGRLAVQLDYYHMSVMYVDYSFAYPWVDWGNGIIRYSAPYDFMTQLGRQTRSRNALYFVNDETFSEGMFDVTYWEGFSNYAENGMPWRDCVEPLMMRRIYQRPGTRIIPLAWCAGSLFGNGQNYRDYANLVLSHLLMPMPAMNDPYNAYFADANGNTDWIAAYAYNVAYFDTSLEYAASLWKDVDLQPCWWRDSTTDLEAYAFGQGADYLVTAMKHDPNAASIKVAGVYRPSPAPPAVDTPMSADTGKLGLAVGKRTFIWQFKPRDPDQAPWYPRHAGIQNQANWDKLFDNRTCTVIPANTIGSRLNFTVTALESELTRIVLITQVPAVFGAVEGKATNLLLPTMLGGSITGQVDDVNHAINLSVTANKDNNTILAWWPAGWKPGAAKVDGQIVSSTVVSYGSEAFVRFNVPSGTHAVLVQESPVTVTGTVTPDGYLGDLKYVAVQVQFRQGGSAIQTVNRVLDSQGRFSVGGVGQGTYDVAIKGCVWLRKVLSQVVVGTDPTDLGNIRLIPGDISGDNTVSVADLTILLTNVDSVGN